MFEVADNCCYVIYLHNDKMIRLFCCLTVEEKNAFEDFLNSSRVVDHYTFYCEG